jgi:serine acetyltransferase
MIFSQDIKQYKKVTNRSAIHEPIYLLIFLYRCINALHYSKLGVFRFFGILFFYPFYLILNIIFGVSIPRNCKIGRGLIIYHYSGIVINGSVVIGENCVIRQGVTIGNKNFENDVPVLGNNVDIGAGAVIIGKIKIGNNVKIGANAVVLKDVPDSHIAVGNPARNI